MLTVIGTILPLPRYGPHCLLEHNPAKLKVQDIMLYILEMLMACQTSIGQSLIKQLTFIFNSYLNRWSEMVFSVGSWIQKHVTI